MTPEVPVVDPAPPPPPVAAKKGEHGFYQWTGGPSAILELPAVVTRVWDADRGFVDLEVFGAGRRLEATSIMFDAKGAASTWCRVAVR